MRIRRNEPKAKQKIGDRSILDRWNGIPTRVKKDISKKLEFQRDGE